jgi:hypothetical protein
MGLLVLRECGGAAVGACSSCGRMLCAMHMVMGSVCPECSAMQGNVENESAREAANRNSYYSTYGEPSEFGDADYFNADEVAAPGQQFKRGEILPAEDETDYDPFDT